MCRLDVVPKTIIPLILLLRLYLYLFVNTRRILYIYCILYTTLNHN